MAYLAVEQREFSREYLATMLWPDLEKTRALANLRQTLSHLRSTMEAECIITERDQVRLNRQFIDVDVNEFHSLLSSESSDPDHRRRGPDRGGEDLVGPAAGRPVRRRDGSRRHHQSVPPVLL